MTDEIVKTESPVQSPAEATLPVADMSAKIKSGKKKRSKVKITKGKLFINSTYNNTIISAADTAGNVLVWSSAGRTGFKGSKKSTPYAG